MIRMLTLQNFVHNRGVRRWRTIMISQRYEVICCNSLGRVSSAKSMYRASHQEAGSVMLDQSRAKVVEDSNPPK